MLGTHVSECLQANKLLVIQLILANLNSPYQLVYKLSSQAWSQIHTATIRTLHSGNFNGRKVLQIVERSPKFSLTIINFSQIFSRYYFNGEIRAWH